MNYPTLDIDKDEVRRQLAEVEAQVLKGQTLGSHARIVVDGHSLSIKEARQYLSLPSDSIRFAVA